MSSSKVDDISYFDFGYQGGKWVSPSTYIAKVCDGLGVCVYNISSGLREPIYCLQFFPADVGGDVHIKQYVEYLLRCATDEYNARGNGCRREAFPFFNIEPNVLTIMSVIENQRSIYEQKSSVERDESAVGLPHAEPSRATEAGAIDSRTGEDVG